MGGETAYIPAPDVIKEIGILHKTYASYMNPQMIHTKYPNISYAPNPNELRYI